ncbi:MAG: hypothetical protein A3I66_19375 [Burkholderiales bacterium RIFCSPLOWO2_02_FULL_57_36]|nr:MAG: hypothetical protein A3I66_19375 [Burkholderiales bacterium RIFCSPLOWO2_02_FULL_57_36]
MLAGAGALLRCPPLAVLVLRRVGRLASPPAPTAKLHNLFLRGPLHRLHPHGYRSDRQQARSRIGLNPVIAFFCNAGITDGLQSLDIQAS